MNVLESLLQMPWAATLGNSKIGAEIRSRRLLVRDIVKLTITNEIHPLV
jgi:hypothetical protein